MDKQFGIGKYMNKHRDEDNEDVYEVEDWEEALKTSIDKALKKNEGKKKKKDPNAPKRPTTAFFFYCADNRGKIKEKNPDLKASEVAKKLGEIRVVFDFGSHLKH